MKTQLNSLMVLPSLFSWIHCSCYNPHGTDLNVHNSFHTPCNPAQPESMCCHDFSSPSHDDSSATRCLVNGLCWSNYTNSLWRESCTDPTWHSESCLKLCVDPSQALYESPIGASEITLCDDFSLCCGNITQAQNCCDDGKGVWLIDGRVYPKGFAFSSPSTSVVGPSHSANETDDGEDDVIQDSFQKGNGVMLAASVLGGLLAMIGIGMGACLLTKRRRKTAKDSAMEENVTAVSQDNRNGVLRDERDGNTIQLEEMRRGERQGGVKGVENERGLVGKALPTPII